MATNKQIQKVRLTMERRDAIDLHEAIIGAANAIKGGSFDLVYAMKMNRDVLRPIIDALNEARMPSEAFQAFTQQRIALCEDYAVQENGAAKTAADGNSYLIDPERQAEFDKAIAELRADHKVVIESESRRQLGLPKFLRGSVTVTMLCFPVALLPVKEITVGQRMAMLPLFLDAKESASVEESAADTDADLAVRSNGHDTVAEPSRP